MVDKVCNGMQTADISMNFAFPTIYDNLADFLWRFAGRLNLLVKTDKQDQSIQFIDYLYLYILMIVDRPVSAERQASYFSTYSKTVDHHSTNERPYLLSLFFALVRSLFQYFIGLRNFIHEIWTSFSSSITELKPHFICVIY